MSDKEILVTRSSMPDPEEYVNEIKELWDSHWLTNMGVKHRELQQKLEEYLQVEHLELMVNGHMALELTFQAMGLKGEVITTPFTFASTTHALVRCGLEPVFCDVDPVTYTMDPAKLEELITERTCAVVPVHVYGNICHVEEIERIARKHGLKVIYDAAHAFGETYRGRGIGSFGDASIFSFHATKVFNTIEGGAVAYPEAAGDFGRRVYLLKDFGIVDEERISESGANGKMNEFAAAMGLCNLRHVDGEIEKRRKAYERYMERLDGVRGVRLNCVQKDVKRNYSYFPVIFQEELTGVHRDRVQKELEKNGIRSRKYFYPLTSDFDCYRGKFRGETPVAKKLAGRVLTLPIYADLAPEDVDRICEVILGLLPDL